MTNDYFSNIEFEYTLGNANITIYFKTFPISDIPEYKPLHTHAYHEFVYACDDGILFEHENGTEKLSRGDAIIITRGYSHVNNGLENIRGFKIGIDMSKKGSGANDDYSELASVFENIKYEIIRENKEFFLIFEKINSCFGRDFAPERIKLYLKEFVFAIYDSLRTKSGIVSKGEIRSAEKNVSEMIHIELIYRYTEITLSEIARKVFLSERQVNRICEKMYGRTFNRQRSYLRVERAKKLLASSLLDITSISLECGFSSLGSFYSAFEAFENITPKKYRELHGEIPKSDI